MYAILAKRIRRSKDQIATQGQMNGLNSPSKMMTWLQQLALRVEEGVWFDSLV